MLLRELFEASQSVGMIFGRFNPPHKGHKAAWEMLSKNNAWYVGTNKSTQGPKDPLPYDIKIKAMAAIWPEVANHIVPHQSWLTLASEIYKKHGDVELKVYTDEAWVLKTLNQYNGVEKGHGFYNFPKMTSVPTPRLSSATALRTAVANNDPKAFADAAGVPADTPIDGKPFFDLVAEYLGQYKKKVKEQQGGPVIDNKEGWGSVPWNQEVDYRGLRVKMKPSVFEKLAASRGGEPAVDKVVQHIKSGGSIGAPFLQIRVDEDDSQIPEVVGHEGRSRMLAIAEAYGDVPIEVHLFFQGKVYRNRHITPEFVEKIQRYLISENDVMVRGPLFTK